MFSGHNLSPFQTPQSAKVVCLLIKSSPTQPPSLYLPGLPLPLQKKADKHLIFFIQEGAIVIVSERDTHSWYQSSITMDGSSKGLKGSFQLRTRTQGKSGFVLSREEMRVKKKAKSCK